MTVKWINEAAYKHRSQISGFTKIPPDQEKFVVEAVLGRKPIFL